MQNLREQFERIDEPRAGPIEKIVAIDREASALAKCPQLFEVRPHGR
jgi:hypothetical protein